MNTRQVRTQLQRLPVRHVGVYASDRLPADTTLPPSTALVVNTDPHNERGEHWVAFYVDTDGRRMEFFDSFGRPPHQPAFQSFLKRNHRLPYVYNRRGLQGPDTSVCGHYCLGYLYCRSHGLTMQDFV